MAEAVNPSPKVKYFGTFQGVFTPTLLTILGVIMYIRHPWVVGNAGIIGAIVIVVISVAITLFTSLSMASMTTNIRIESGGAFSIISQSLGLEIGGSIGIPLYFSQACVVAMYIFGFRDGWLWIFADHSPILIDVITLGIIALIGIMVNDGLVLISKFNSYLKEGLQFEEALFAAGKSRFRAIFLTTITTVAGLADRQSGKCAPFAGWPAR